MQASNYVIIIYGPAGSGKTTLTGQFGKWIKRNVNSNVASVNLDAAVLNLPYKPEFDIRSYITAEELMKKYNLGPNGAIMKAVEETEKYLENLFKVIDEGNFSYVLIDTPGIMEVFTGREFGRKIVDKISERYTTIGVFVMDASTVNKASELIYFKTLYVLGGLKLGLTTIPVWSKSSLATKTFKELINMSKEELLRRLMQEEELYTDAALGMAEIMSRMEQAVRVIKIDSVTGEGLSDLYDIIHETLCVCGDLT